MHVKREACGDGGQHPTPNFHEELRPLAPPLTNGRDVANRLLARSNAREWQSALPRLTTSCAMSGPVRQFALAVPCEWRARPMRWKSLSLTAEYCVISHLFACASGGVSRRWQHGAWVLRISRNARGQALLLRAGGLLLTALADGSVPQKHRRSPRVLQALCQGIGASLTVQYVVPGLSTFRSRPYLQRPSHYCREPLISGRSGAGPPRHMVSATLPGCPNGLPLTIAGLQSEGLAGIFGGRV